MLICAVAWTDPAERACSAQNPIQSTTYIDTSTRGERAGVSRRHFHQQIEPNSPRRLFLRGALVSVDTLCRADFPLFGKRGRQVILLRACTDRRAGDT